MTVQDILVKNKVFKEVGVDINFNLQVTRDCYIHTQRQIEKAMQEYARLKCQELLLLVAEKANIRHTFTSAIDGKTTHSYDKIFSAENSMFTIDKDYILNAVDLDSFIV